jgi:hypothetical protein
MPRVRFLSPAHIIDRSRSAQMAGLRQLFDELLARRLQSLIAVAALLTLVIDWRVTLGALLVLLGWSFIVWRVRRSARLWLLWLRLRKRSVSLQGVRGAVARVAVRLDPPSKDDDYAWRSRRDDIPLVVPVLVADAKRFWPDWAFNIRILRNGLEVRSTETGPVLTIRLGEGDYAVYNNHGKRWVRQHLRADETRDAEKLDAEFEAAVRAAERRRDCGSTTVGSGYPLRWASAGCLPVVDDGESLWVCLFFRDIFPKGWNVANGASESVAEQWRVEDTLRREFREELLVLDRDPWRDSISDPQDVTMRPLLWPGERLSAHQRSDGGELRHRHDGLRWVESPASRRDAVLVVTAAATPWRLEVVSPRKRSKWLHDIVPSIHARELGVEAIQVVRLRVGKEDALLDGEVLEQVKGLIRRPVARVRLAALQRQFREHGTLGEDAVRETKQLAGLAPEDVQIGGQESRVIPARISALEAVLRGDSQSPDAHAAAAELEHLRAALPRHVQLTSGQPLSGELARLGPVTWRTLEAYFRYETSAG